MMLRLINNVGRLLIQPLVNQLHLTAAPGIFTWGL